MKVLQNGGCLIHGGSYNKSDTLLSFRPIITLDSNVELVDNSTNGWSIQ